MGVVILSMKRCLIVDIHYEVCLRLKNIRSDFGKKRQRYFLRRSVGIGRDHAVRVHVQLTHIVCGTPSTSSTGLPKRRC